MKISFADQEFFLHASGALYWEARRILVIADAHLEKGSSFAPRGFHLPPYDSHMTLAKLLKVCEELPVEKVLILGDFFHDNHAHHRLSAESVTLFQALKNFTLIWIRGNHDTAYQPEGVEVYDEFEEAGIIFRHESLPHADREISGHFHPKCEFVYKGKFFREPCFIEDGRKLMLPAFGAYTGGLSVKDKAISKHFAKPSRTRIRGRLLPRLIK